MPRKTEAHARCMATLAGSLRLLRRRSGLTQAELARRLGTTQTAIARLEAGRQSPSLRTLEHYARATGFGLELGFVRTAGPDARRTGCILVIEDGSS